jgi:hypothetical protein
MDNLIINDPLLKVLEVFINSNEYQFVIAEPVLERDKQIIEMALQYGFIRGWSAHRDIIRAIEHP